MVKRTSAVVRLVATAVLAVSLTAAAAGPAAAKNTPNDLTRAQQVRELVLKQREKVLAQIAAIMSGETEKSQQDQVEIVEADGVTAEDGEPEGSEPESEEPEDGEAEDGEAEDGEGEDEDVLELPETGVGYPRGADGASSALLAVFGILAAVGLSVRRRFA